MNNACASIMRARFRTKSVGKTYPETEIDPLYFPAPQKKEKRKPVGRKGKKRSSNGQQTTPPSNGSAAAATTATGTSSTAVAASTAPTAAGSLDPSPCHFFITLRFCHI